MLETQQVCPQLPLVRCKILGADCWYICAHIQWSFSFLAVHYLRIYINNGVLVPYDSFNRRGPQTVLVIKASTLPRTGLGK